MRVSVDSEEGLSKTSDYRLSTQDLSPKSGVGSEGHSKRRPKKNMSVDGRGKETRGKEDKPRARKVKSARNSITQKNEFFPKGMEASRPSTQLDPASKTTPSPSPLIMEREDYSYKVQNELTRDEIRGYEKYIQRPVLSGEEFVKFISVPLRKKSALELALSERKAQGYFLKSLTVEELMEEKNRVKNELKYYDKIFFKKVGKTPSNQEKEPLK